MINDKHLIVIKINQEQKCSQPITWKYAIINRTCFLSKISRKGAKIAKDYKV